MRTADKKRAIVAVSFGTTYAESINTCIAPIEEEIATAFPAYQVCRAFTSQMVRRRLREQGIVAEDLAKVLERLAEAGCEEVIVQPTHIIDGAEYRQKVVRTCQAYRDRFARLMIGTPLLVCGQEECSIDHVQIARAVSAQIPAMTDEKATILMGHGSKCEQGSVYPCLQAAFDRFASRIFVGVMAEGDAMSFDSVVAKLAQYPRVRRGASHPATIGGGMPCTQGYDRR